MLDVNAIVEADLQRLTPEAIATLAQQMLGQTNEQRQHLKQRDERIAQQAIEPTTYLHAQWSAASFRGPS